MKFKELISSLNKDLKEYPIPFIFVYPFIILGWTITNILDFDDDQPRKGKRYF
jgi:hypothetical protein